MDRAKVKLIKEYCYHEFSGNTTMFFSIRTKYYDNSILYYMELLDELKKDFPDIVINPKHVKALEYGGNTYRGQRGIEVKLPNDVLIPADYTLVSDLNHLPTKA